MNVHFEAQSRDRFLAWEEREAPRTVLENDGALSALLDEMRDNVRLVAGPLHDTFQEHWTASVRQPVPSDEDPFVVRIEVLRTKKEPSDADH